MCEIAIVTASKDPCNWVDSYEKKNSYFEFALVTKPMMQRQPNRTELIDGFLYPNVMNIPKM